MEQPIFDSPSLKLSSAKRKFAHLVELLDAYGKSVSFTFEDVPGNSASKVLRLSEPPPADFVEIFGECIHSQRACLDLIVADVARLRGVDPRNPRLQFPFSQDLASLEKRLSKEPLRDLGKEAADVFRMMAPHDDAYLSGLNELDNLDKHALVLPIYQSARMTLNLERMWGVKIIEFGEPEITNLRVRDGDHIPIPEQGRIEDIFQVKPGSAFAQFPLGGPFAGQDVLPVLYEIGLRVSGALEVFMGILGKEALAYNQAKSTPSKLWY